MDMTSFAALDFAVVMEGQRELERNQRKWLFAWKDLCRAAAETAKRDQVALPTTA